MMSELGLLRVADSKLGDAFVRGLSGGEKRRVRCDQWICSSCPAPSHPTAHSVAAELITEPAILVLDEVAPLPPRAVVCHVHFLLTWGLFVLSQRRGSTAPTPRVWLTPLLDLRLVDAWW